MWQSRKEKEIIGEGKARHGEIGALRRLIWMGEVDDDAGSVHRSKFL
jgi:hypothetical protein